MLRRLLKLLHFGSLPTSVEGTVFECGTSVPSDTTTGYETGCVFLHTDGSAGDATYINEGDSDSCDFNVIGTPEQQALSEMSDVGTLTYGSGKILVADGDSYEEVAVSGDATLASTGSLTIATGAVEDSMIEGLSDGQFIIGVDGTAANNAKVTMSGDATLANDGALTLADDCVGADEVDSAADITVGSLVVGEDVTNGIEVSGSDTTGLLLSGTFSGAAISGTGTFNSHFLQVAGSTDFGANKAIYIGAWGSEAEYEDDGGLFRIYGKAQSGGSTSAMIFTRTLTDSTSSVIGYQVYADSDASTPGPTNVEALNCFAMLNSGKYLAASASWMNGLKAGWFKVGAAADSVCNGNVAPIWVDNQVNCAVGGEEYGIIATTGGSRPDGFIGFETSSSGYNQLLYFDSTFNSGAGTCITTDSVPGTQDARIKVWYDGKQYYIPLYRE